MRKFLRVILPVGLIALSIMAVSVLVGIAQSKRPERKEAAESRILVDVIPVRVESLNLQIESQGTVRPRTQTTLVPEVAGKIVSVSPNFIAGGFFRAGEVLLQIDPSDYEAALKRAQANLASTHAQYADQKARSEQALKDWQNLGRQGEPSDLTLRKPQLAEALAAVQSAEADLAKAERDLARTRIAVPYDGLVRLKQADIGQYVSPGSQLGITFAIDTAEIRLPLTPQDVSFINLPGATELAAEGGPPVTLTAEGSGIGGAWDARIIRTEGVIDETSRVIYAVAQVVDPYGVLGKSTQPELKMGTFVRATIEGRQLDHVAVLPRAAVRQDDTVLVATPENELEIRPVSIARAEPQVAYIDDGLQAGELVITTSLDAPIPGTKLTVSGNQDAPGAGTQVVSVKEG